MEDLIETISEGSSKRAARKKSDGNPKLIFNIEDVTNTSNMLSRLVRLICYRERITHGDLDSAIAERVRRRGGNTKSLSYAKPNLMKAIKAEKVTFEKVVELFQQILGWNVDIVIKLSRDNEETREYEYSVEMCQVAKEINKNKRR